MEEKTPSAIYKLYINVEECGNEWLDTKKLIPIPTIIHQSHQTDQTQRLACTMCCIIYNTFTSKMQ